MKNLSLINETIQTWDKLADVYWDKFSTIQLYDATYDSFLSTIPKEGSKVLDLCCGPGNIAHYIYAKRKDIVITGVDGSKNMIKKAKEMVPGLSGKVLELSNISILNEVYDGIICGFGLPYLSESEVKKCIEDCYRLLEKKGILYFSFVEGNPALSGFVSGPTGDRSVFYYYKTEDIVSWLIQRGFSPPEIFNIGYPVEGKEDQSHVVLMSNKI